VARRAELNAVWAGRGAESQRLERPGRQQSRARCI
jgi:hypothetical protein